MCVCRGCNIAFRGREVEAVLRVPILSFQVVLWFVFCLWPGVYLYFTP